MGKIFYHLCFLQNENKYGQIKSNRAESSLNQLRNFNFIQIILYDLYPLRKKKKKKEREKKRKNIKERKERERDKKREKEREKEIER